MRGTHYQHEVRHRDRTGKPLLLDLAASCLRDRSGETVGVICIIRDITERAKTEQQLLEMNIAMKNTVEGICRIDRAGRYEMVNKAYADMLGYHPGELAGRNWRTDIEGRDLGKIEAAYQEMLSQGKAEADVRAVRKDGSVFISILS